MASDDAAVVFSSSVGDEPRRVEFAAIRSVRVARIGTLEACVLTLADGTERTIATDDRSCRADYAGFVRGLFARLHPRGIAFIAGSWLVIAIAVSACAAIGILAALAYAGVLDLPFSRTRMLVTMVVTTLACPAVVLQARPRSLRSADELDAKLPKP
ncbi:MAG: hypothetical protein IPN32_13740 [Deltaproteobacteria bacterium]|nr:hypothetical protein [Deltaproteobacteria bacterium]